MPSRTSFGNSAVATCSRACRCSKILLFCIFLFPFQIRSPRIPSRCMWYICFYAWCSAAKEVEGRSILRRRLLPAPGVSWGHIHSMKIERTGRKRCKNVGWITFVSDQCTRASRKLSVVVLTGGGSSSEHNQGKGKAYEGVDGTIKISHATIRKKASLPCATQRRRGKSWASAEGFPLSSAIGGQERCALRTVFIPEKVYVLNNAYLTMTRRSQEYRR